ncbi:28262_t:CDS:2, partial [Gigaspora margarita]
LSQNMNGLRLATLGRVSSTFKPGHWKHAPFQKQYKPDHKGLEFGEATKFSAKPKQGIVKRIDDAISNPCPLIELSEMAINVEKLRDAPEAYPDFLNTEKMTTLIRSPPRTWKTTALREIIIALKDKVVIFLLCHAISESLTESLLVMNQNQNLMS